MRQFLVLGVFATLISFTAIQGRTSAADDAESLLRYLPSSSNTIAVVRVREIMDSPRAKREGWQDQTLKFLAGADTVPAWADALVLGSQYQPGTPTAWTASAVLCSSGVSVAAMAQDENRQLQHLGSVQAMHTARDAYLLQLAPNVLGVMSPALRQESSRWVRMISRTDEPQLTPFLLEQARTSSDIVMAIDMLDMLDPRLIRNRLEAAELLEGNAQLIDELADLFAGIQGAAIHLQVEDETDGRIDLTFSDDLPDQPEAFKTLLVEMLVDESYLLRDFLEGTPSIDGNVFSIKAKISDDDLRGALTMILSPYPTTPSDSGAIATMDANRTNEPRTIENTDDEAEKEEIVRKNRKYYAGVKRALDDVQRMTSTSLGYDQSAGFLDRYAEKIDNLPREDVDPMLLDFAAETSDQLRTLAASTRMMVTDVNTQEGTITTRVTNAGVTPVITGYRRGGWWRRGGVTYGYAPHWNVDSNVQQVRERQADSITQNSSFAQEIQLQIRNRDAEVRRAMESKYGVEFTKYAF